MATFFGLLGSVLKPTVCVRVHVSEQENNQNIWSIGHSVLKTVKDWLYTGRAHSGLSRCHQLVCYWNYSVFIRDNQIRVAQSSSSNVDCPRAASWNGLLQSGNVLNVCGTHIYIPLEHVDGFWRTREHDSWVGTAKLHMKKTVIRTITLRMWSFHYSCCNFWLFQLDITVQE